MTMDIRKKKELIRMEKKMDYGLVGMRMDRRGVNGFTRMEKEMD